MLRKFIIKLQGVLMARSPFPSVKRGSNFIILTLQVKGLNFEICHKQVQSGVGQEKLQSPMTNLVNTKRQTNAVDSMIQNVAFASRVLGQNMT